MVKLLIDLLDFLRTCAPLFTSLAVLIVLCILFSKSIRKHATIFYIIFAIPFVLVLFPFLAGLFGVEMAGFVRIPFLGEIIRDYIHMGTFGHPLLIIIMYIGALDLRTPGVGKLMSIRKELSIVSGFAVFTHSLIRIMNNLPGSIKFFTNNAGYMAETKVASEVGAGISSFSFILGVVMLIIFIPLWVTSFGSVRRHMGNTKWKKLQKWSYVLYATLFIHAMGIQIGGMLNPRGGHGSRTPAVETVVKEQEHGRSGERAGGERQNQQVTRPATGGRTPTKGFADIEVSAQTKRYIHLFSLLLIYGSYLFLRLRKAKKDAEKKSKHNTINI